MNSKICKRFKFPIFKFLIFINWALIFQNFSKILIFPKFSLTKISKILFQNFQNLIILFFRVFYFNNIILITLVFQKEALNFPKSVVKLVQN